MSPKMTTAIAARPQTAPRAPRAAFEGLPDLEEGESGGDEEDEMLEVGSLRLLVLLILADAYGLAMGAVGRRTPGRVPLRPGVSVIVGVAVDPEAVVVTAVVAEVGTGAAPSVVVLDPALVVVGVVTTGCGCGCGRGSGCGCGSTICTLPQEASNPYQCAKCIIS